MNNKKKKFEKWRGNAQRASDGAIFFSPSFVKWRERARKRWSTQFHVPTATAHKINKIEQPSQQQQQVFIHILWPGQRIEEIKSSFHSTQFTNGNSLPLAHFIQLFYAYYILFSKVNGIKKRMKIISFISKPIGSCSVQMNCWAQRMTTKQIKVYKWVKKNVKKTALE